MAIGGSGKGIQIVVGTDYNDRDLKRAQRDLDKLKGEAAKSAGPMSRLGNSLRTNLGPALAMAGAAAASFAIKLGVDAVRAAAAEEQAVARLSQALDNAGQSLALDGIEAGIDRMARATGVADDSLRPAMITLVNATQDAAKAQDLLSLALDISAGSGRDLSSVTMALSKAANGQVTALRRLGVPLSDAAVKSKDLNAITAELQQTFRGQAAKAANTFQGRLNRLNVAVGELQEAFGQGLMDGLSFFTDSADSTAESIQGLEPLVQATGEAIGQLGGRLGDTAYIIDQYSKKIQGGSDATNDLADSGENAITNFVQLIPIVGSYLTVAGEHAATMRDDAEASQSASVKHADYRDAVVRSADAARGAVTYVNSLGQEVTQSGEDAEDAAEKFDLFAAAISKTEQVVAFRQAVDEVGDAFKKANTPVNIFGEQGEENFNLLKGLIERTASYSESQTTLAGKASVASQGLGTLADAFTNTKMDAGTRALLLEPFQALIDDLREANVDVTGLQSQLDALKSKTITVTTNFQMTGANKQALYEADGGMVAGRGFGTPRGSDTVPAMLTPGEFVVRSSAVQQFGRGFFSQLNRGINPLQGMTPTVGGSGSGLSIGSITVQAAPGERAETSLPRALRRASFLAGVNG
jgi:uncharacterized protein YukE